MKGIRRHGAGWQTEVRVAGQPRSVMQWPLETPVERMSKWRKDEQARLRLAAPRATKGTFAADARRYLTLVQTMPSLQSRTRDIELWTEVFGTRPRSSITRGDIRAQRDEWHLRGPKLVWRPHRDGRRGGAFVSIVWPLAASTVNHRLRALANLYTVLDGRHAPNPAREVPELEETETEDRALPYDIIEAILAAMPERRYGRKLTPDQVATIRDACAQPGHNKSAIATSYGVSETMIRKIASRPGKPRVDTLAQNRARLEMIAFAGVSQAEIARLRPHTVSVEGAWIDTGKRRKGRGVLTGRRPLTPRGVEALKRFIAADAFDRDPAQGQKAKTFSRDSMRASFKRAVSKVLRALEASGAAGAELAAQLRRMKLRPYDLRHSYVSEVLEKSGDLHATQLLVGHADLRTTLGYGRRAINPALRAALDKVTAAGGFR